MSWSVAYGISNRSGVMHGLRQKRLERPYAAGRKLALDGRSGPGREGEAAPSTTVEKAKDVGHEAYACEKES